MPKPGKGVSINRTIRLSDPPGTFGDKKTARDENRMFWTNKRLSGSDRLRGQVAVNICLIIAVGFIDRQPLPNLN